MLCLPASLRRVAVLVLLSAVASAGVAEEAPSVVEIGPGKLADPVVCATAPELSYALYLPSGYQADRPWPVLFLFDAEGRGALLAERFRRGADRWGFALVASNDAARDTPWEINQRVVRILLADAFRHVTIDSSRLHFGGFGGTARLAWSAGLGFRDAVTGVLLMGGTTPASLQPSEPPPFPVFSITATEDFNHDEVVRLDAALDEFSARAAQGKGAPAPHRLAVFEGGNEWPPEELATTALGWFHLQAMRRDRIDTDSGMLATLLTEDLERAQRLEADGELLAAAERYQALVRDYEGLLADDDPRLRKARQKARELSGSREVEKARKERRKHLADAEIYRADLAGAIVRLRNDRKPPQPNRLLTELKIPLLQKRVEDGDPDDARAARRMLELAFVYTSYYLPPELMERGLYRHAAASLTVASEIHPEEPQVWLGLARAYARAGERTEAQQALDRAIRTGASREALREDEVLGELLEW